jgi:hypothetical protein
MDSRITPPPPTLGYLEVEALLGDLFGVKPRDREGWFRARIIRLRRYKLTPPSGRGKVVAYDRDWVGRWFLALLLTLELGNDPEPVAAFMLKEWRRQTPADAIDQGTASLRDLVEEARERKGDTDHIYLTVTRVGAGMPPHIRCTTGIKAMESIAHDSLAKRVWPQIVDLTVALRQLDAAIDKAAAGEPEPPKKTAREILATRSDLQAADPMAWQ